MKGNISSSFGGSRGGNQSSRLGIGRSLYGRVEGGMDDRRGLVMYMYGDEPGGRGVEGNEV